MSGAQSWSLSDLDPKIREAARAAAARQGLSLGEYLNQALAKQQGGLQQQASQRRPAPPQVGGDDDWRLPTEEARPDPSRLVQRIEAIERRTQLAVNGLDRAVSTIDRSLVGLSARIEDAELATADTAERIAHALEQFRLASETLSGRLQNAEHEAIESRRALDYAASDMADAKERLENQVTVAQEIARRAEAAVSYISSEMQHKEEAIAEKLEAAREAAEEAAREAAEASHDAVQELRRLQEAMSARLAESERAARQAVVEAIEEIRAEASTETRTTREALLEEVVRLEGEIAKRMSAIDRLKADQSDLIGRIERAEQGARETTAGLRQAAGAAIADLRNAQLTLAARVKQIEETAGPENLAGLHQQQQDIAERLASLERKTDESPVAEALAAFERRVQSVEAGFDERADEVDGAVRDIDQSLQRLAARLVETESTANTAIRTLEETVSSLSARVENAAASEETEALRAMLEQRLDHMALSVQQMVGDARVELAGQLQAALDGVQTDSLESALADVNRRLAAAERRQAQTIEAISHEIRRMSETVDHRLRAVEARNEDAAGAAVREELSRMAATLEQRFDEIERREAAAFDRMGLEVGRLSERLEERVSAVENRSAQAIEQVGEQVARMADRFNQRQEQMSRELSERMLDSEERSGARVADAISSIMQRLAEVEQQSVEAIAPVQKAVSSVASKLDRYESAYGGDVGDVPQPLQRRIAEEFVDFADFGEEASPMDAARPLRAGPLTPTPLPLGAATEAETRFEFEPEPALEVAPETGPEPEAEPQAVSAFEVEEELTAEAAPQPADEEVYFTDEAPAEPERARDEDVSLIFDDEPAAPKAETAAAQPPFEWTPPPLPEAEDLVLEDLPLPEQNDASALDDTFWTPEDDFDAALKRSEPLQGAADLDLDAPLASAPSPPAAQPPSRNDYLAAARRAAQAQSAPRAEPSVAATPRLSLRGSSRIVLWGAASVITLLAIGGARLLSDRSAQEAPPAAEPTPQAPAASPPAAATTDDTAPAAQEPPIAEGEGAEVQPAAVAGPLLPRNVSLEQAAQAGNPTAQYELALQRLTAGRTQEGVTLLRNAADRGFAMAQYRLAKLFERGEGVPRDLAQARAWTERAAGAGNRRAMHDLGVYFARGEGTPVDEAAAFRWFRQAAELGVADSQYNLGVLYQQGRGVAANSSEALFWFLVAARQGDADAGARAAALEAQLAQAQVEQARARSEAFRPRAASALANGEFGARPWARPST